MQRVLKDLKVVDSLYARIKKKAAASNCLLSVLFLLAEKTHSHAGIPQKISYTSPHYRTAKPNEDIMNERITKILETTKLAWELAPKGKRIPITYTI